MKNTFENQSHAQGWNTDSQVNIFTDFINSNKLVQQVAQYAGQYAEMENSVSIDLGVNSEEDFEEAPENYENKSFQEIAEYQGWDNDSKLNIMRAFVSENKLAGKLNDFCTHYM